ncbi:MAG: hypothetical protein K2O63_01080 [Alistipes sp.]|nr:hypothetical protein [Alistipes sp.]
MKKIFLRPLAFGTSLLLLSALWGCTDHKEEPTPPGGAGIAISDVRVEASSVTYTVVPTDLAGYSYSIESEVLATEPEMVSPARTATYTYDKLLPSSDYTIVIVGYDASYREVARATHPFRTLDSEAPDLDIPTGEPSFIEYGDQRVEIKTAIYYQEKDLYWLFVSPLEGYDNYIDLIYGNKGQNDYISLSIAPSQLGKPINMKSASTRYALLNSMNYRTVLAPEIPMVTIDYHSSISDGGFIITRSGENGEQIEGYIEMTAAESGKKLRIYATCTYDEEAARRMSILTCNGTQQLIGSAFYRFPAEERSELFFSPGSAPMGDLIDQADDYHIRVSFDEALACDKTRLDLSQIDKHFEFEYYDPATRRSVVVSNAALNGAQGSILLHKYALQGLYLVEYDITVADLHLQGFLDGALTLYSYYKDNAYVLAKEEPVALQSAVIDRRDKEYYTIYLAPEAGLTELDRIKDAPGVVIVKVSPQALTGESRYFYQEKEAGRTLSITFDGVCHDNQNPNRQQDMIRGAVLGEKIALEFLEKGVSLEGYYGGRFTAID